MAAASKLDPELREWAAIENFENWVSRVTTEPFSVEEGEEEARRAQ